jgi:uncharacterized protein involved in outer membrane biogenesis
VSLNESAVVPRYRRWPGILAIAFSVGLVAVASCEVIGWPFLAEPMQRWLSSSLQRRVSLAVDGVTPASARVRLLGRIRLEAPKIEIGAPSWSQAPYMLRASDAVMVLHYADLLRAQRGEPLRIHSLQAAELDGQIERLADGRASWQFGTHPVLHEPGVNAFRVPLFDHLKVESGALRYRDEPAQLRIAARFVSTDDGQPAAPGVPANGLRVSAEGAWGDRPVTLTLRSAGALPWADRGQEGSPVPVAVDARIGDTRLTLRGTAVDVLYLGALAARYDAEGPSLAALGDALKLPVSANAAFRARGSLVKQGQTWQVVVDELSVGQTLLHAAFGFDFSRPVPLLQGRIAGPSIVWTDLGWSVSPAVATMLLQGRRPPRRMALDSSPTFDANLLVDVDRLDIGASPGAVPQRLHGHVQLSRGVLVWGDKGLTM